MHTEAKNVGNALFRKENLCESHRLIRVTVLQRQKPSQIGIRCVSYNIWRQISHVYRYVFIMRISHKRSEILRFALKRTLSAISSLLAFSKHNHDFER